ncbi:MAG: benzoate-CoA ligase family protein [Anaerolineae bacterium]|nr:benzoate-CoA ligase family protein [Anaerolineae bacterium]
MSDFTLELPDVYNASAILFDNLAAGRAEKIAIYCGDDTVTYGQLAETAGRVGNGLKDLGLETGARVMMLLMDTPQFPATFFGTMRAGFVPIPTNTVLPPDNYEYFLNDSGATVAIVSGPLYPKIAEIRANCPTVRHVIVVGGDGAKNTLDFAAWTAAGSADLDPAPTGPNDQAFWLYSSGSTGFPKGVVHQHKNIPYTTETYGKQVLGITENDICFSASKAFHAYGLGNNVTFPYSVGASTVMLTGRPTPDRVYAAIERFKPTIFFTAPTLYTAMLAAYEGADMSSIRVCVSAAEALQPEVYRQWHDRFGIEILDGIGSTEMLHIFISNRAGQVKPGSSGVPVPGYEAKIVDEHGNPVAQGEAGDLLIKGGSAAAFYWNRPEKTAHTMRGEWMFTGDRYYQDEDGYFYYEGRSDDMFKVSGQWVSPIEVENTLMEHPAVFECAVVIAKDEQGLQRTKAFIILAEDYLESDELTAELQAFVKARLAPYKYPRMIAYVTDLPKTATGKIQRFKLRE